MKIVRLGPDEVFHRFRTPKWAFVPLSGVGAAIDGGRFNRPGVEALYLSRTAQTALDEYRQGGSITPPATLAAYKISLEKVADLSGGYDPASWSPAWAEWDCNWRRVARIEMKTPPSWLLADSLIVDGFGALLFPSLRRPGGTNLVVFNANLASDDNLQAYDPDHLLPKDQSSWPGHNK
jgi:RES domain-containing protein